MRGKHDRSANEEQPSKLLLTGPIAIRGLGRGVKDALVPGPPSRHRAFTAEGTENDAAPTPLQQVLAGGPTISDAVPSSTTDTHVIDDWAAPGADAGALTEPDEPSEDQYRQKEQDVPVDDDRPADERTPEAGPTTDEISDETSNETSNEFDEFDGLPAEGIADDRPIDAQDELQDPDEQRGDADEQPGPEDRIELLEAERPPAQDPLLDATEPPMEHAPTEDPEEPGAGHADEVHDLEEPDAAESQSHAAPGDESSDESQPSEVPMSEQASDAEMEPSGERDVRSEDGEPSSDEDRLEDAVGEGVDDPPSDAGGDVEPAHADAADDEPDAAPVSDHAPHDPIEDAQHSEQVLDDPPESAGPVAPETDGAAAVDREHGPFEDEQQESEAHQDPAPGTEAEQRWVSAEELFAPALESHGRDGNGDSETRAPEGAAERDLHVRAAQPPVEEGALDRDTAGQSDPEERASEPQDSDQPDEIAAVAVDPARSEPLQDASAETGIAQRDDAAAVTPGSETADAEQPKPEQQEQQDQSGRAEEAEESEQPAAKGSELDAAAALEPMLGAAAPQPALLAAATAAPAEHRSGPPRISPPSRPPERRVPFRERFGREAIGIAVLVVLALICAGLITAVVIKTRNDAAIAAREAANYTPPPLTTPTPTPTPTKAGPVVAVIGDGSTASAGSGITAKQRWTSVLASSLGGTVSTEAASGMGYATKSTSGNTFVQAAAKVPSDAKAVVFFGGAADSNIAPLSLAKAATDAFAAAKQQAPKAKVLVVGPAIFSGVGTADLMTIRSTLRSAAAVAKATWIDPLDAGWLPPAAQSTPPSDLSVTDEKALASKMQNAVQKAIG